MKVIFMLSTLLVLTNPVLAKPVNNTSECLKMYGTYMNDYGASRFIPKEQMLTFYNRCMSADSTHSPASSDEPYHEKLLQIIDDNKKIKTIRT